MTTEQQLYDQIMMYLSTKPSRYMKMATRDAALLLKLLKGGAAPPTGPKFGAMRSGARVALPGLLQGINKYLP